MRIQPAYPNMMNLQLYPMDKTREEISHEYGITDIIRLSSNENPLGCSPHVTLAITSQLGNLSRYPDGAGIGLKKAIATHYGLRSAQITLGSGSSELLNAIFQTFIANHQVVVYSQYALSNYERANLAIQSLPIEVPAKNFGHDLDAMLDVVKQTENCKIVLINNPNNPTGTLLTQQQIREFVEQISSDILVVIDEAYIDFCDHESSVTLLENFDNVMILRTFSKAYGLAGLRIGYVMSSVELADMLYKTHQSLNTNVLAHSAGITALQDRYFIEQYLNFNHEQKQALYKGFDSIGIAFVKSATNFIMVNVDNGQDVYQSLLEQGVIVRSLVGYGLPEWIRVSVGLPEDNNRFLDTLVQVLT